MRERNLAKFAVKGVTPAHTHTHTPPQRSRVSKKLFLCDVGTEFDNPAVGFRQLPYVDYRACVQIDQVSRKRVKLSWDTVELCRMESHFTESINVRAIAKRI